MLVPGSWGENCAYINHSGKEIESSQVVLLEKNQKHFWLQLQALASHTPHQAGQVWEARAPNPGALLESIQFDCCCKEWARAWSPGHSATSALLIVSIPTKANGKCPLLQSLLSRK